MDDFALPALGATLLACVFAVLGVRAWASGNERRHAIEDRLSATGQIPLPGGRRRSFRGVDRRLRKTRFGGRLQRKFAATGLDVTPGEFSVYVVAAVAGAWMLASSVLASFFGPVAGIITILGANAFLSYHRTKRIEAFIGQLPELSRVLANATRAGLALRTSIAMAAEELEAPAGDELKQVADRLAVGHSVEDALGELAERLPSRELTVLVTTLVLSNKAGGQVVTSLRNLTETLEERKETRREVRTQLSQVNMTALAVPVLGLGALLMMNQVMPGSLDKMTSSILGQAAVLVAFGLYGVGFLVIRRMSKIDV